MSLRWNGAIAGLTSVPSGAPSAALQSISGWPCEGVVDEAGDVVLVADHAQRQLVGDERDVDGCFDVIARVVRVRGGEAAHADVGLELLQVGRLGNDAHDAGQRTGAEQRALRAAQHLDAVDVDQAQVRLAAMVGQHAGDGFAEVGRGRGGHAAFRGADAADADRAVTPAPRSWKYTPGTEFR